MTNQERSTILAMREGYRVGLRVDQTLTEETINKLAKEKFPLPKIIKPRILSWDDTKYKVENGILYFLFKSSWEKSTTQINFCQMVIDLASNPTMETDDE